MRSNSINMISGGTKTMASNINSDPIFIGQAAGYSIQAVWTGTPTGTFKIQVSNDAGFDTNSTTNGTAPNVVNWTDYTGSSVAVAGAAGTWVWDATLSMVRWVRLVYTAGSSTGTLTIAQLSPKGN